MIRRGRDEQLDDEQFATIKLGQILGDLQLRDGETMDDVERRLDPERISSVLGVTAPASRRRTACDLRRETAVQRGDRRRHARRPTRRRVSRTRPRRPPPAHVHQRSRHIQPGRDTHKVDVGDLSMIEGAVPHAVGNPYDQPHVLIAIGCPPRELDAEDRMTVCDWDGHPVLVEAGQHTTTPTASSPSTSRSTTTPRPDHSARTSQANPRSQAKSRSTSSSSEHPAGAEPWCTELVDAPARRCPTHTTRDTPAARRLRRTPMAQHQPRLPRHTPNLRAARLQRTATEVHHRDGRHPLDPGANNWSNLQALCHPHHSRATARQQRGKRLALAS